MSTSGFNQLFGGTSRYTPPTAPLGVEHATPNFMDSVGAAVGVTKSTGFGYAGIRKIMTDTSKYWSNNTMPKKQANELYNLGMKDDGGVVDRNLAASLYLERQQEEMDREYLQVHNPGTATILAGGFIASLLDPAEFALNVATGAAIGAVGKGLAGTKAVVGAAKAGRYSISASRSLPIAEQILFRGEEVGNTFLAAAQRAANPLDKMHWLKGTALEAATGTAVTTLGTAAIADDIGLDYDYNDAVVDIVASTVAAGAISVSLRGAGVLGRSLHQKAIDRIIDPEHLAVARDLAALNGQPVHVSKIADIKGATERLEAGYADIAKDFVTERQETVDSATYYRTEEAALAQLERVKDNTLNAKVEKVPDGWRVVSDLADAEEVTASLKKGKKAPKEAYEPKILEAEEAVAHSTPIEREILEEATTPERAVKVLDNNVKDVMDSWMDYIQVLTRYPDNHRSRRNPASNPAYNDELTAALTRAQESMEALGIVASSPLKMTSAGIPKQKSVEALIAQLEQTSAKANEDVVQKVMAGRGDNTTLRDDFKRLNKAVADQRSVINRKDTSQAVKDAAEAKIAKLVPELLATQKALQELEPGSNWATQLTLQDNMSVLKGILPDEFVDMVKALSGQEVDVELPLYKLREQVVRNIKDRIDDTKAFVDELANSPAPDRLPPADRQLLNDVDEFLKLNSPDSLDPVELQKALVTGIESEVSAMEKTGLFDERQVESVRRRLDEIEENFAEVEADIAALKKAAPIADACSRLIIEAE